LCEKRKTKVFKILKEDGRGFIELRGGDHRDC
jgi:hypothetical protein